MNIKSIQIKNVRGLQDHTVELGQMYPNKPSLMVAPNGSGKSSFALAFQWLNQRRIKLNKDDAYNGDETNSPELIITTDEPSRNVYKASADQNQISPRFGIFVINSDLKVKSPGYAGGVPLGKTSLSVSPIILLENKPDNVDIINDFYEHFGINNPPVGLYPSINALLANNDFMASFNVNNLSAIKRSLKQIEEFIERMKTYEGTISAIHKQIEESDLINLKATTCVKNMMDAIKEVNTGDNDTKLMLKAIQIITLYKRNEDNFKRRIAYSQYMKKAQSLRDFFHTVPTTWKGITPHEENGTFKLEIGDAQRISNGERDTLVFLAKLQKAKMELTKLDNILIIDEVFDYLDDANLMAAQYYITQMIKEFKDENRNIYPIIMSHLNPDYYNQHYSFKDMKVYYLCPFPHPHISDNMLKLVRKRSQLAQALPRGSEEDISKYMLHFHSDYTKDLSGIIGDCPPTWGNITNFKESCKNHLEKYLNNEEYDPLAVCVALREKVESYCYNKLYSEADKINFLEEHGTGEKLKYAEEHGVDVPEIFMLLSNLYNDPLHATNKNNKNICQTLYSRMENNTIRKMIGIVKKM